MPATIQPAIVGATGYAGFELARLLLRHPQVKKPALFTREGEGNAPAQLDQVYPHVSGNGGYPLESFSWNALQKKGVNVLFLATPHEVSRAWTPEALRRGVQVVDLSGAWRINTPAYREVYAFHDADPQLADELALRIEALKEALADYAESPAYSELLTRMARYASKRLGGKITVTCRKEDEATLKAAGAKIGSTSLNSIGGFKADSEDGTLELDLTFEELLRSREDEVRASILGKE